MENEAYRVSVVPAHISTLPWAIIDNATGLTVATCLTQAMANDLCATMNAIMRGGKIR